MNPINELTTVNLMQILSDKLTELKELYNLQAIILDFTTYDINTNEVININERDANDDVYVKVHGLLGYDGVAYYFICGDVERKNFDYILEIQSDADAQLIDDIWDIFLFTLEVFEVEDEDIEFK